MSFRDDKEDEVNGNLELEVKNDDDKPPLVFSLGEEFLATGKSTVKENSSVEVDQYISGGVGLAKFEVMNLSSREETYQDDLDDDSNNKNKKCPSLVINAALRWYERELELGGILLFDWLLGQFQVLQSMQTFKHQKTFLVLHHKNIKRLFSGMFNLLQIMTRAGIAHNNISLETIMLLKVQNRSLAKKDDLLALIDSPPWIPLLTSFGCSSLASDYNKRAPRLSREQFHKLFKDYCPVVTVDDRAFKKVTKTIKMYCGEHSNYARYLAPEGNPVAPKGDLWSLGVLLWECLTDTFLWENPKSKLYRHMITKSGGFKGWFNKHVQLPANHYLQYFVPADALDLLHQIFKEKKRISLKNVLKHKFLSRTKGKPAETTVNLKALASEIKFALTRK